MNIFEENGKFYRKTTEVKQEEVSKSDYITQLTFELDRRFEDHANELLKFKKQEEKVNQAFKNMMNVVEKLKELQDYETVRKHFEYSRFRYKDLYPKKAKELEGYHNE